jgi:CitMHS family citrate-Mg2+:H+ or citrate-Ca2+:H+ symporter
LSYGSAVILGTPIIFLFNNLGFNVTVVTAALSLMFPLGDCLPPSRIVGRLSIEAVQYEGSYMSFLKEIMVPAFFMAAVALIMFIFPNQLSFLVVY